MRGKKFKNSLLIMVFIYASGIFIVFNRKQIYHIFETINLYNALIQENVYFLFTVAFIYVAFCVFILSSKKYRSLFIEISKIIFSAGGAIKSEKSFYESPDSQLKYLKDQILSIKTELKNIAYKDIQESELDSRRDEYIKQVVIELNADVKNYIVNKYKIDNALSLEKSSLSRLSNQIVVLGSRANISLLIGIIFCLSGILILWYSFFYNAPMVESINENWPDLARTYLPRTSLVILIQVIGFFFLKLYRATLSELRYIQNEITNVEMKLIALWSSVSHNGKGLDEILGGLVKTDRNHILEKNQTTVEIEKQRISSEMDKDIIDAFVSVIRENKPTLFNKK